MTTDDVVDNDDEETRLFPLGSQIQIKNREWRGGVDCEDEKKKEEI